MEHQPQNFAGGDSRIASYVPNQKPEWKRYKQYTRSDILSAIECVRTGMSALQASRKFGVPSRTLYDKVKKLGITTGRPMNRTMKRSPSNGGGGVPSFPYGLSGTNNPFGMHQLPDHPHHQHHMHHDMDDMEDRGEPQHKQSHLPHSVGHLLDPTFLQQALEARGGDMSERGALHAMHALAAAAHAAANGRSTSPENQAPNRSPSPNILMKYMRHESSTPVSQKEMPSPNAQQISNNGGDGDEEDKVEDLSMSKKSSNGRTPSPLMMPSPQMMASPRMMVSPPQLPPPPPPPPSAPMLHSLCTAGVIVPPTLKIKSENFDDHIHDHDREMKMPSSAAVRMDIRE
jgi:hypothetical protein